jgi:hypothetical protein
MSDLVGGIATEHIMEINGPIISSIEQMEISP